MFSIRNFRLLRLWEALGFVTAVLAVPQLVGAQFGYTIEESDVSTATSETFGEIDLMPLLADGADAQPSNSRRTSTVLHRLAAELAKEDAPPVQRPKKSDPTTKKAEAQKKIAKLAQSGKWNEVKAQLKEVPQETAAKLYTGLLTMLAEDPLAGISPEEFLPLADVSPSELTDRQVQLLAEILEQISAQTETPTKLLKQLRDQSQRLGMASPKARLTTARILLLSGRLEDAADYLPDFETALKSDDPAVLNLCAEFHQKRSQSNPRANAGNPFQVLNEQKSDPVETLRAWQLTTKVLMIQEKDTDALKRLVSLLLDVPENQTAPWLQHVFQTQPSLGFRLLATIAEQYEATVTVGPMFRLKSLRQQQLLVEALLDSQSSMTSPTGPLALRLMSQMWIREAQKSAGGQLHQLRLPKDEELPQLSRKDLLKLAPSSAWIDQLDSDTVHHVRHLTGVLATQLGDRPKSFEIIQQFAKSDPELASQLAAKYLKSWIKIEQGESLEEVHQNQMSQRLLYPGGFSGFSGHTSWASSHGQQQSSEPAVYLTRAKQIRSLRRLTKLLTDINSLGTAIQDKATIANAFATCHSPAEVFRRKDIHDVLGDPDSFSPELTGALVSQMRKRLAGQWRSSETQEQAGTKRTDRELIAEIDRGYQLAESLLIPALNRTPQNQSLRVLLATVLFDRAEFLYGQKVDLKTYIGLRDQSFQLYRDAAKQYAAQQKTGSESKPSMEIFWQWFQSALGASDLAYLTRQDAPDRDQIEEIAAIIDSFGGDITQNHLQLFGKKLTDSLENVPGALRPNYLREGMRIVGDHPSGETARKRVLYYEELLSEVQLHLEVDGSTNVGNNRPFGVRISLRNTTAVGQEGGGLIDLANLIGSEFDPIKNLEDQLKERLGETFFLDGIRFHKNSVSPSGFGRPGWRQTPVGYAVLRTKDPAVDRIPSISIDLPFNDGDDYVMLPIASPVVMIDSRSPSIPEREIRNVSIKQVLDDRTLSDENSLRLEISATATGLLPELEQLLDLSSIGKADLEIEQTVDHGLDVASLDTTGRTVKPLSRRSWTLELKPASHLPAEEFVFPTANKETFENTFERYADADIVKASQSIKLSTPSKPASWWVWGGGGLFALLGIGIIGFLVYRNRQSSEPTESAYHLPDRMTPFTALSFLERIRGDESISLSPSEQEELERIVQQLQQDFFRTNSKELQEEELNQLYHTWLHRLDQTPVSRSPFNGAHSG